MTRDHDERSHELLGTWSLHAATVPPRRDGLSAVADRERRRRILRREGRGEGLPAPVVRTFQGIPVTRLGLLVLLLLGFWIGRVAAVVPGDMVEFVVAVVSAVTLAIWYRRRAREYMQMRSANRRREDS